MLVVSLIAEPEVLLLLAFAAIAVGVSRDPRPLLVRWTRAAVLVAAAVQVPVVLWTAWRTFATRGSEDAVFLSSPAAQASIYLLLGSVLLVAISVGAVGARRSPPVSEVPSA